jgi:hypothetical protein
MLTRPAHSNPVKSYVADIKNQNDDDQQYAEKHGGPKLGHFNGMSLRQIASPI